MTDVLLAIDIGTSSTKLLAVDRTARVARRGRLPHDTDHPTPGAAEQNPDAWWHNLATGCREIGAAGLRPVAIGVTGQMHGLVTRDRRGRLARPAMIWQDRRSTEASETLRGAAPAAGWLSAGVQAASWRWLVDAEPETADTVGRILLPKDDIVVRLTGNAVTEPSDAIGTGWFDPATGDWDSAVLRAAGATRELLPRIVASGSVAGPLTTDAARTLGLAAGIPVVTAGGDAAVGAFGAGATRDTPLVMLSTGCQVLQPVVERPTAGGWPAAAPDTPGQWLRVATTLNGGNAVDWARTTFGDPTPTPVSDLIFLPYLAGERSETLAPDAAGAFIGLRAHHDRPAMARAALDGVALALADAFRTSGGEIATRAPLLVGGGGSRDTAWLAAIATAFGRPLDVIAEPDLSAWGATRSAAVAVGWLDRGVDPDGWRPATERVSAPNEPAADVVARLERFRAVSRRVFGVER